MLDILTFRVLSGVLLGVVLIILLASRRPREGRGSYVPAAIRKVPRALHGIWLLVSVLVPLAAILIAVVAPQLISGTSLNLSFPGDLALQLAGLGLFGVGGALLIWSDRHLGRDMVVVTVPMGYVYIPCCSLPAHGRNGAGGGLGEV